MSFLSRCAVAAGFAGACSLTLLLSPALADVSAVVQSWRTDAGWLTELRKHADGALVCTTGKAFRDPNTFGLSIVQSGPTMLITLVDEASPPSTGGPMRFSAGPQELGALASMTEGPAFATTEQESGKTRRLISDLPDQLVTIAVADRQYQADLTGLTIAREQLRVCESEVKAAEAQ
ncbi:hypothetical protein [Hyphomicrobium sp.]|uniref:hypothetical protein n=1 Tax=Hyphomicrobium sp. TaxID=82 RepID=UPI002D794A0B|nr:hypothetical protein [Hyphomicrobium sp.]HET6390958.1 hypothetical protein [Hyphomicrobium sp.]